MSGRIQFELTLNDVAEFHQQLHRLHAAGLRLQLEDDAHSHGAASASEHNLSERLNEIMAGLASQLGSSQSLSKIIWEAKYVPQRYRLALETWHKCDRSVEALAVLRAPVHLAAQRQTDLRYALLLPSIICVLIYCASFYLLLVTVPRMEAIYDQLNSPPSQAVGWLIAWRAAMPCWGLGLPLLLALGWYMLLNGYLSLPNWLVGRWQSSKYLASSLIARNLATQIEHAQANSPVDSSVQVEGKWPGPIGYAPSPMLQWALSPGTQADDGATGQVSSDRASSDLAEQQSRRLRLAASLYETMQTIHAQRLRLGLTLFGCIVLGGGLTLLYALALFAPMIQLLKDIVGR